MLLHEHFVLKRRLASFLFEEASKDAFAVKIYSHFICGKCFDFSHFIPNAVNAMLRRWSQTKKMNHSQNDVQKFKHLIMYVACYIGRDAISYHLHCQP